MIRVVLGFLLALLLVLTRDHASVPYVAIQYDSSLKMGGELVPIVKVNCDGTVWIDRDAARTVEQHAPIPPLFAALLAARLPTLTLEQQEWKERSPDADMCMSAVNRLPKWIWDFPMDRPA